MKIFLLFVFSIIFIGISKAQVGINTDKPLSNLLLHIAPLHNTTSTKNQTDDVVITKDVKLGIGTTSPQSDLTIATGSLKINDGTQGESKILVAMSDGSAFWQQDSLNLVASKFSVFYYSNFYERPKYNEEYLLTAREIKSITNSIDKASFDANIATISLPAGYYNISFLPSMSSTPDLCSFKMYIDDTLFLQNHTYTGGLGFSTLYESSTDFSIHFSLLWERPQNSNSEDLRYMLYSPSINTTIAIEKLSF